MTTIAAATAGAPSDAARAAIADALAHTGAPVGSGAAISATPVARPTDADLDGLLARIMDRARVSIDATGTSLTTEFHDPALGLLRLAVTEDAAGLIRAVLTAADPSSVALLQQTADRHRAAGEMASVDLRIRSEADPGRQRDPRGETPAGSTTEFRTAPDGRRSHRDDSSSPPPEVRPIDRPVRARRDTITDPLQRSSRLGRTIDRIA